MRNPWDENALQRHKQIVSGLDLTFSKLMVPEIIRIIKGITGSKNSSIIEIGCGTGVLTQLISHEVMKIVGIDLSEEACKIARDFNNGSENVTIIEAKIEDLKPSFIGSFNIAVAHMVFHTIDGLDPVFKNIDIYLKPPGYFIYSIPHPCFYSFYKQEISNSGYNYIDQTNHAISFTISNDDLPLPSQIPYFHRSLSTYCLLLNKAGFYIESMLEPFPDKELLRDYQTVWNYPRYIIFVCRKILIKGKNMRNKKTIANLAYILGDVIGDLISVIIAAFLIIRIQTQKTPSSMSDISELLTGVLAILIFIALTGIWDRFKKLRHIENLLEKNQQALDSKVLERVRAEEFFQKEINIDQTVFEDATKIDISGITLGNTSSEFSHILGKRLSSGAIIRIILLDTNPEVLNQIVQRSWGTATPEYYSDRITNTSALLRIVGNTAKPKGTLEIGYLPFVPSFGITIIDSNKPEGRGWVEIYHHNSTDPSPSFELTSKNDSYWFRFFLEQFDLMWKLCRIEKIGPPPN